MSLSLFVLSEQHYVCSWIMGNSLPCGSLPHWGKLRLEILDAHHLLWNRMGYCQKLTCLYVKKVLNKKIKKQTTTTKPQQNNNNTKQNKKDFMYHSWVMDSRFEPGYLVWLESVTQAVSVSFSVTALAVQSKTGSADPGSQILKFALQFLVPI